MPPGRGRGRGRGRGKSSSDLAEAVSSTLGAADAITQPSENDPSPNSSPVTIPTETPAPTPARVTSQRTVASSASGAQGAGNGKLGGKETAAPTKFKPKNVRRGQSEREELARAEMQRKENIARDVARAEALKMRGRGRGFAARGRGDAMGRREERRTFATGTFGIAPEEMAKASIQSMSTRGFGKSDVGDYQTTEGGRGSGGGSRSGPGGGSGSSQNQFRQVIYPSNPDEKDTGHAIDIEQIGATSDDDSDDVIITGSRVVEKGKSLQKGGLKPVRLTRHEHKARQAILNDASADADTDLNSILKKEESDDDIAMTGIFPRSDAPGDESVSIKTEPGTEISYRDAIDSKAHSQSNKPAETLSSSSSSVEIDSPPTPPRVVKVKAPGSPQLHMKRPKKPPVFTCEEDKAEYARHLEDVAILAAELGGLQSRGPENEGDVDMDGAPQAPADPRDGRIYLFQFPPVLPKLYNPLTSEKPLAPGSVKIKQEDRGNEGKDAVASGASRLKGKPGEGHNAEIKPEEEIVPAAQPEDKNKRSKRDRVVDEQGYVGQLIVRESGKVELSWGGTSLAVGRGVDASFLTTGVVVDANMQGARPGAQPHEVEGKAVGMGKIMGKFVVTPDFAKMFGEEFS